MVRRNAKASTSGRGSAGVLAFSGAALSDANTADLSSISMPAAACGNGRVND